jgi:hypothetical protein
MADGKRFLCFNADGFLAKFTISIPQSPYIEARTAGNIGVSPNFQEVASTTSQCFPSLKVTEKRE